jgi:hypothetical protein
MEKKLSKIIFIVPYYGEIPPYFEMWLKSAACNRSVDFLLITDTELPMRLPNNVIHLQWSWSRLEAQVQSCFDFPISLKVPYKLCDFKPALGFVFRDYIQGYDFWGNCDMDLVFGDIRKFVTEEILNAIDIFGYLGHFILYRNTESVRQIFKKKGALYNYKTVFSSNEHYAFDEITGLKCIVEQNQIPHYYNDSIIADAFEVYRQMKIDRLKNYKYQVFYWENGKVFRSYLDNDTVYSEEYLYIHFQKKKPVLETDQRKSASFYIFSDRFENKSCGVPSAETIREKADWGGEQRERMERFRWHVKKAVHFLEISNSQRMIWISQHRFRAAQKKA